MGLPSQFQARLIQARLFNDLLEELSIQTSRQQALDIIHETVRKDARRAGQAFALMAPTGPDLTHFSSVVQYWLEGNVLDISQNRLNGNVLDVTVTRCGYVQAYKEMGVESDLIPLLSCPRDEAFAQGYSSRLTLERPHTIANGHQKCDFHYVWTPQRD